MTPVVARLAPQDVTVPAPPSGRRCARRRARARGDGPARRTGPHRPERGGGACPSSPSRASRSPSPTLRRAESTGAIDLALAARLADIYGTTTD